MYRYICDGCDYKCRVSSTEDELPELCMYSEEGESNWFNLPSEEEYSYED